MNARESRALARIDRLILLLRQLARRPNAAPAFVRLLATLETSLKRLHDLAQEQFSSSPALSNDARSTAHLRKRLRREYMIPLTRLGRRLFRFAPAVEKTLKVPHARVSHRELVTAAEAMLKAVRPHREVLRSAEIPDTFLSEFRDLTRELKRIATTSYERQVNFAQASRAFRQELASANETLRMLEGLALGLMDRDRNFAQRWKHELRTPKPLGRPPKQKRKRSPNELAPQDSPETPLTA